jgi:hypothetical protein
MTPLDVTGAVDAILIGWSHPGVSEAWSLPVQRGASYPKGKVYIQHVLTRKEYDRGTWKVD